MCVEEMKERLSMLWDTVDIDSLVTVDVKYDEVVGVVTIEDEYDNEDEVNSVVISVDVIIVLSDGILVSVVLLSICANNTKIKIITWTECLSIVINRYSVRLIAKNFFLTND